MIVTKVSDKTTGRKIKIRGPHATIKPVARTNMIDIDMRVGPGEFLAIKNALHNWGTPTALEVLKMIDASGGDKV